MMIAEHTHDDEVGGVVDRRGARARPGDHRRRRRSYPGTVLHRSGPLRGPVVAEEGADLCAAAIAAAHRSGLSGRIPFILGDDGSYDHDLNRFLRACPTMGVRSPNSLRAYGRDLVVWMRFLAERCGGKSVWSADREDVAAFHVARRRSEPPHRISAASWNRSVAALEKFYGWAAEEGLIAASRSDRVSRCDQWGEAGMVRSGPRGHESQVRAGATFASSVSTCSCCSGTAACAGAWTTARMMKIGGADRRMQRAFRRASGHDRSAA